MANTKPLASQVKYGSGNNTVDKTLKKSILSFPTLVEAQDAAASLPDGQVVVSDADDVRGVVGAGVVTQEQSIYKVADYAEVRSYTGRGTRLRITDPTGAHWWVRKGVDPDNGGTVLVDAKGRSWEREYSGDVNVQWFGAVGDGINDDTHGIQQATSAVAFLGGGAVFFPAGDYKVYQPDPSGGTSSSPKDAALYIGHSNITWRGVKGATRIFSDPSALDRFAILRIGVLPISNGAVSLSDVSLIDIEFDGSAVMPVTGSEGYIDDQRANIFAYGVKRLLLSGLHIHHSSDYGIGLQNGGLVDCLITNCDIEDCYADGIDVKNNGGSDSGNKIDNLRVRRVCRATPHDGIHFACLDFMGIGWELNNIHITQFGGVGVCGAGIRIHEGESGSPRGAGAHRLMLNNFYISAEPNSTYAELRGLQVTGHTVKASNGFIENCVHSGVCVDQRDASIANVSASTCGFGFIARSQGAHPTTGMYAGFSNCVARANRVGFQASADNVSFAGCHSVGNGTNLLISSTYSGASWVGGSITSPVESNVINAGAGTKIIGASGFASSASILISDVAVDSVGARSFSIPHNLPYTPRIQDIQLTVIRGGSAAFTPGYLSISGVSSVVVSGILQITSASPEAGAKCQIAMRISCETLPPFS